MEDIREYSGVWVFVEQRDGVPCRVSLELLGRGRLLADKLQAEATALLIGHGVSDHAEELIHWGADRVMVVDDPLAREYRTEVYTHIIAGQVKRGRPEILLVGATWTGRDLAPRLAARLHTGCTSDCTDLDIDTETGLMVAVKPFLGRDVMAEIICPEHRPQMATIRSGILELPDKDDGRTGDVVYVDGGLKEEAVAVKVVKTERSPSGGVALDDAEKIVAVGMGVGDEAGFERVRELAQLLGAELGSTTLPIDAGWISEAHKIGQTGKSVRPRFYLACGVSGAVQHTVGMINSELVIAINKDPKAEIFSVADYGIVGDLAEVVPAIIAELKSLKS
ncbi:MAG: electron transfer flavoprotein subunit alpha/FixB family protein [Deltaproteobacteria bacterium]|nr:electron transfer flavoprotein subunit alpha/FixB family protein [Deltaproteobacteria bacterium]